MFEKKWMIESLIKQLMIINKRKKIPLRSLASKIKNNNKYHEDFGKIPKYIMEMKK